MEREEALQLVDTIRSGQFEDAFVEVKSAHRQLPKRTFETLSAFANRTDGGVLVLGVDEEHGFNPVGVANPQTALTQLAEVAAAMEPPLRLDTVLVEIEGKSVIVAEVPECAYTQKPCFYKPAGMNSGSYIRVGNTNRQMTDYEIFTYVSSKSQATFDREPVPQATPDDLDQARVQAYLDSLHRSRPQLWERLRMDERPLVDQLCAVDIAVKTNGAVHPTLAGLLCFGVWPQKFFPSLVVTFVRYAGSTPDDKGPRGERFLDTCKCEGTLTQVVEEAARRTMANMRQSLLVEGIFHRTLSEYPEEAVREAIVNAIAHRDYGPLACSSQVRIQMYADRLEVQSPGGLYGAVNEYNLEESQSTRNQLLMRFLEELRLVENRGSGIRAMIAAMREARLEPPRFQDSRDYFQVTFKNASLMSPEAVRWLNQFSAYLLNDNQRMALVYLRYNSQMTNSDYRRLNNVYDTTQATRELRELVEKGLVEMHASRRWAYYTLGSSAEGELAVSPLSPEEQKILQHIRKQGGISRQECAALLGVSPSQAAYLLKRMRDKGYLQQAGQRRWARYVLPQK
ncbi:MAG: putative DNA binding domain-containing protein [Thermoflexales bacterium]|nr:putative DNA binding domain-containing protein [Thermoflexales bacterium]